MIHQAEILAGIIRPDQGDLSEALARYVLSLGFGQEQHTLVEELSEKAQLGTLTNEEQATLDEFLRAEAFLAVLKSKARVSLRQRPSAA